MCFYRELHQESEKRRNKISKHQLAWTKKFNLSRIRFSLMILYLLIKATLNVLGGLWIINALLADPPTSIPTCATQFETGCFPKLMLAKHDTNSNHLFKNSLSFYHFFPIHLTK